MNASQAAGDVLNTLDNYRKSARTWRMPFALCIDHARRQDIVTMLQDMRYAFRPIPRRDTVGEVRIRGVQIGSVR